MLSASTRLAQLDLISHGRAEIIAGRSNIMAAPTPANLQRLGALLADGSLRVPVQATYELAQAPEALAALSGQHNQGKLAIKVS